MDGKQADIFLNDTKGFQNKEREKSLKTLVETIRHTNGTNMTVISTNSKEFVEWWPIIIPQNPQPTKKKWTGS